MHLISLISLLSFIFLGCASHDIRQLVPEPLDTYQTRTIQNGVVIAADRFSRKERTEAAFTLDLNEQGIVPILLVLENRAQDNILLLKEDIELTDSRGNIRKPVPANIVVSKFEHNKMAYALLGFGIFSYMSAEEANKKMLEDWRSKELPAEKVLIPSRKAHGVVYFELGAGLSTLSNSTLRVPLSNMRTSERTVATLRILSQ